MTAASEGLAPGKRARHRQAVEADILRVAREHLATDGAAALSLRAVARDLGMVSSGLYRYVTSRDDLLTRLIVDSFASLATEVRSRHDAIEPADLEGRWAAIGSGLRDWATARPHDFALIYGSPVPDYQAPPERTVEVGTAVLALIVRLLHDAGTAGRLVDPKAGARSATPPDAGPDEPASEPADEQADARAALGPLLAEPFFAEVRVEPEVLARGVAAWTLLLGAVTSEVFHQLGELPDVDALFRSHLRLAGSLFLRPQ